MTKPTITISEDFDTGMWTIMATSYGQTMPAGPRLFRAPPHPDILFQHDTEAAALHDAAELRKYIADSWPKKEMSKAKIRKQGAD